MKASKFAKLGLVSSKTETNGDRQMRPSKLMEPGLPSSDAEINSDSKKKN